MGYFFQSFIVSLDAANQLGHLHLTSTQGDPFETELQAIKDGNTSLLGLRVGGSED